MAHLASLGFPCHVFGPSGEKEPFDSIPNLDSDMTALVRWIKRLPRPVAIFACYDIRGMQVLEACRYLEVHTPDEVAVLGVDNDELLCDLADPPLSSIIPDGRRTGYEAAAMLDRLMGGERLQDEGRLFDPQPAVKGWHHPVAPIEHGLRAGSIFRLVLVPESRSAQICEQHQGGHSGDSRCVQAGREHGGTPSGKAENRPGRPY